LLPGSYKNIWKRVKFSGMYFIALLGKCQRDVAYPVVGMPVFLPRNGHYGQWFLVNQLNNKNLLITENKKIIWFLFF
jgi:hypothetical protein